MDELFATLVEGLANLNKAQKELEASLQETNLELNTFEGEYAKEVKLLQRQIDDISAQIDRLIKEAVKDIMPKDGQDAEVDYDLIKSELIKLVEAIPKPQDGQDAVVDYDFIVSQIEVPTIDYRLIDTEIKKRVDAIPVPKDGEDGEDAPIDYEAIYSKVKAFIAQVKPEYGKDGEDGVSIVDIVFMNGYLTIKLSDGTERSVKMPKMGTRSKIVAGGTVDTTFVRSTATDINLTPNSVTVLADGTSGVVNIKLPDPALSIINSNSYRIAVHKVDTTANAINILPFNTELVVFEANQSLLYQSEILNFITDGTNWYLSS